MASFPLEQYALLVEAPHHINGRARLKGASCRCSSGITDASLFFDYHSLDETRFTQFLYIAESQQIIEVHQSKSQVYHRTFVLRKKEKRCSLLLKYAYLSRPTPAPGWCRTGTNPYPHHKDSKSLRIHFSIPIKLLFVFNLSNLTLQHARYNG